jgi:hypothetical protein
MAKNRNLVIMAAVLVILIGVSLMQKAKHEEATSGSHTEVILDRTYAKEDLDRIVLGYADEAEAVVMSFAPDGWRMDTRYNALINEQRIDGLLRSLSNLEGEFRSDKDSVLDAYSLDEAGAVHIHAYDKQGQEVLGLLVGKTPERSSGNFVRLPGHTRVYLTQKGVLQQIGLYGPPATPQAKYFLELQAFKEDRVAVERILIEDGETTLDLNKEFAEVTVPVEDSDETTTELDRNTWEWKLADQPDTPLAKTKVDGVLGAAVSIRAQDVADPTAPAADLGLDQPARRATLFLEDGSSRVLEFGAESPAEDGGMAGTFFRVQGEKDVWVISSYTTNNLFKTLEDLTP